MIIAHLISNPQFNVWNISYITSFVFLTLITRGNFSCVALICTCRKTWNFKERISKSIIARPGLGKQNVDTKEVYQKQHTKRYKHSGTESLLATWRFVRYNIHLEEYILWRTKRQATSKVCVPMCLSPLFECCFQFSYDGQRTRLYLQVHSFQNDLSKKTAYLAIVYSVI